jgi:hypothetical protein
MSTGLPLPVRPGPSGGTPLLSGADQAIKLLLVALGADETENAFELDRNLGYGHVFGLSDPVQQALIRRRLIVIFSRFETDKRFRLVPESIAFTRETEGELVLSFRYIDLETDRPETFRRKLSAISQFGA